MAMKFISELQTELQFMEQALKGKGCCSISVTIQFSSAGACYGNIFYIPSAKADTISKGFYEPFDQNLADMWAFINEVPPQADRERAEFYKLVARAAEYGRSIGADETLINPLAEMAKKLASNALAAPALNDEIPF